MGNASDPEFKEWLEYLEGGPLTPALRTLSTADPTGFERRKREVEAFLADLSAARFEPLSPARREAALDALQEQANRAPGLGRRLFDRVLEVAHSVLLPDVPDPSFALRGDEGAGGFQALYRIGEIDVDLATGEDGALHGQVLGPEGPVVAAPARVRCLVDGALHAEAGLAADGSFRLTPPSGTPFELVIESGDLAFLVPDIPPLP